MSQHNICANKFIDSSDVPEEDICFRKAPGFQSLGNGQVIFKCTCQLKSTTERCICLKITNFLILNATEKVCVQINSLK